MPDSKNSNSLRTQALPGIAMPFSPEAEQSVLGAILLDSSCMDRVTEFLPKPEYFYGVNNGLIYEAMLELFTAGKPVDFITVLETLKENGSFDEATGKVYADFGRPPDFGGRHGRRRGRFYLAGFGGAAHI